MTLAVPVACALVRLGEAARANEALSSFHGVRLGMTPSDVRARIDFRDELRASVADDGTYVLELPEIPERSDGTIRAARFEFHQGILVAIRAELDPHDPWADGDGLSVSESSVRRVAAKSSEIVELTFIARDCPTHADEVRTLLSSD